MTTPAPRTHIRLYLYVAVAVLAALSIALLWLNDRQIQDLQNAQNRLYNAQVEIRVLQAEKMFGAPFIDPFPVVDRHGQPATLPNFGEGRLLLLFFESWHFPLRLDMMSLFGSVIGDNVPVVGVLQVESAEEITTTVEKFRYRFPVFLAVDSPFELPSSPYSVLIDRTGNVLQLSPVDFTDTNSAEARVSEISNMVSALAAEDEVQLEPAGRPDPTGRPDPEVQPPSAAQTDSAAQPPQIGQPDPVADEKAGIYTPTTVDTRAEVLYNAPIPHDNADLRSFEGVVVIQFVVGTTGNVVAAFVERSSDSVAVDSLLVDVARKMVWTPAVREGKRVKMRVSYPFMFRRSPSSPGAETVTAETVTEEAVTEEAVTEEAVND